jgi:hypothetical protein
MPSLSYRLCQNLKVLLNQFIVVSEKDLIHHIQPMSDGLIKHLLVNSENDLIYDEIIRKYSFYQYILSNLSQKKK